MFGWFISRLLRFGFEDARARLSIAMVWSELLSAI